MTSLSLRSGERVGVRGRSAARSSPARPSWPRCCFSALHALLISGALKAEPVLASAPAEVLRRLDRYASVPMSLAEGCVMHLHDHHERSVVLTCDSDFRIYRRKRGRAVDALVPEGV